MRYDSLQFDRAAGCSGVCEIIHPLNVNIMKLLSGSTSSLPSSDAFHTVA
jgi:hypothetical protein